MPAMCTLMHKDIITDNERSTMEPSNTNVLGNKSNEIVSKNVENDKVNKIVVCETHLEGTDNKYYNDGANYWSSVDPSVNGMLGGFGNISNIDIEGSAKFLKGIYKVKDYFFKVTESRKNSIASFSRDTLS